MFFDHPFLKMKPPPVTMPSPLANSPKTPSAFDQGKLANKYYYCYYHYKH